VRRFFFCVAISAVSGGRLLEATLRRSSHCPSGENSQKVWLKQWDLEGSCLHVFSGLGRIAVKFFAGHQILLVSGKRTR